MKLYIFAGFKLMMKRTSLIFIFIVFGLVSCNKQTFQKVLKNDDYDKKYEMSKEFFEDGKYSKALQLLEQLVPYYKGLDRGEEVYYLFALCYYNMGDYILAGYYFSTFTSTYPSSIYASESLFLSAYCSYLDSARPSLDQGTTEAAILEFERFLSSYPDSPKKDTCNILIDELRQKLMTKSYNQAKLYYDIGYYNAASITFENSLSDYPETPFKEEILYYDFKANYEYAKNSITSKIDERYQKAIKKYKSYVKAFPTGKYINDVEKLYKDINKELEKSES